MPQPHDRLGRLGGDLGDRVVVLGIGGAGEQEVLHHQQPELVAGVVELVGLIAPAAPDAHQVDARVGRLPQPRAIALCRHPLGEDVVGDPVDTAHPQPTPVDVDFEGPSDVVGCLHHFDRAETDAPRLRVEGFTERVAQRHSDVVERLRALAQRPPQLGGRYVDLAPARAVDDLRVSCSDDRSNPVAHLD